MAEYIEREAAIKLFSFAVLDCLGMEPTIRAGDIIKALESIPAADVRPAVRCRECKHWETDWTPQGVSDGRHYCAPLDLFPSADWYCSDGEKREES